MGGAFSASIVCHVYPVGVGFFHAGTQRSAPLADAWADDVATIGALQVCHDLLSGVFVVESKAGLEFNPAVDVALRSALGGRFGIDPAGTKFGNDDPGILYGAGDILLSGTSNQAYPGGGAAVGGDSIVCGVCDRIQESANS